MTVVWHLHRDDFHPSKDTVRGVITGAGLSGQVIVLQTVERISTLIPAGYSYRCVRDFWHTGNVEAYEIIWPWDDDGDGQPDRDRLLIHWANAIRNRGGEYLLRGCIAVGLERLEDFWESANPGSEIAPLARGLPGVTASRDAFRKFMDANAGVDEFNLQVTEVPRG